MITFVVSSLIVLLLGPSLLLLRGSEAQVGVTQPGRRCDRNTPHSKASHGGVMGPALMQPRRGGQNKHSPAMCLSPPKAAAEGYFFHLWYMEGPLQFMLLSPFPGTPEMHLSSAGHEHAESLVRISSSLS